MYANAPYVVQIFKNKVDHNYSFNFKYKNIKYTLGF